MSRCAFATLLVFVSAGAIGCDPPAAFVEPADAAVEGGDDGGGKGGEDGGSATDGGVNDGGADAGTDAGSGDGGVLFDTVRGVNFRRLVHGDPALVPPDLIPLPKPRAYYEWGGTMVEAIVREPDAGLFEFDLPEDAGYCLGSSWVCASVRNVDISYTRLGRIGESPRMTPFVAIDAGNMSDAGLPELWVSSPQAPTDMIVGATKPWGLNTTWASGYTEPIIAARGDVAFVRQYVAVATDAGSELHLARIGWTRTVDFTDPKRSYVEVELHAPDASVEVSVDLPSFEAPSYRQQIHPTATVFETPILQGRLQPWDFASVSGMELQFRTFESHPRWGTGVHTGRFPVMRLPPTERWTHVAEASASYLVTITLNGATAARRTRSYHRDELSPAAGSTMGADFFPPKNPTLDGAPLPPAAVALAASTSPVLSWSEPAGGLRPNFYTVILEEVAPVAGGGLSLNFVRNLLTTRTSVRIPPGTLAAERHYLAVIYSHLKGAPTTPERPIERPRVLERLAPMVTGIWRTPP